MEDDEDSESYKKKRRKRKRLVGPMLHRPPIVTKPKVSSFFGFIINKITRVG